MNPTLVHTPHTRNHKRKEEASLEVALKESKKKRTFLSRPVTPSSNFDLRIRTIHKAKTNKCSIPNHSLYKPLRSATPSSSLIKPTLKKHPQSTSTSKAISKTRS